MKFYDGTAWQVAGAGTPVGTVIMYPNINPPPGYLLCDGSTINQTLYPELYALFSSAGGKVPDMKDQFVRGATSNSDVTGSVKARGHDPQAAKQLYRHRQQCWASPPLCKPRRRQRRCFLVDTAMHISCQTSTRAAVMWVVQIRFIQTMNLTTITPSQ